MPVTFPSHAAAILPLHHAARERLWLVPLIAGSCAPDLAYVLNVDGDLTHSWLGVVFFGLPAGLLLFVWLEALLLPALRRSLPHLGRFEPNRLLTTRGLPRGASAWLWAAIAIVLGAATHVLWDGFTHRTHEPARSLYGTVKISLGFRDAHLSAVLQQVSTIIGAAVMALYAWRRYPALPAAPPGRAPNLLLLLSGAAAGAVTGVGLEFHAVTSGSLHWALWLGFWRAVSGALVGLSFACGALLLRERARSARLGAGP